MRQQLLFLIFIFFFFPSLVVGQTDDQGEQKEKPNIFAIVKDEQGDILEGYLRFRPEELTVTSQDNQEKSIPSKYVKSITLERIKRVGPPNLDPKEEAQYSVRMENSQEIYTLRKKYTFSLNTNVGVVTKSIDPETVNSILSKDASQAQATRTEKDKSLIQDKSIVFSLEFKF